MKWKDICNLCDKPLRVRRDSNDKVLWREGHNADPLATGYCCDVCHQKVLEARGASTEVSMMAYMPVVHLEKKMCPYLKGAKFSIDSHHDYTTIIGTFPTLCAAQQFSRIRLARDGGINIIGREGIKGKAKRRRYRWVVQYKPADYNQMWGFDINNVLFPLDEMLMR